MKCRYAAEAHEVMQEIRRKNQEVDGEEESSEFEKSQDEKSREEGPERP